MFIKEQRRVVPGAGSRDAKICIIGEAPGAEEDRLLKPFVGPAGTVLDSCLHAAGLTRQDCYITNTIKVRPRNNDIDPYFNPRTGAFTELSYEWLDALREELRDVRANVIVPLGAVALAALTGRKSIAKYRGYVTETTELYGKRKTIPAYHPAATLRGQYILRYYITADFRKAKSEASSPTITRPDRKIVVCTTKEECREWLTYLYEQPQYSCDIEVVNFQVSAISFAPTPYLSIAFPFYHEHWTFEEECWLWKWVNKLLTNSAVKTFQNGIFDICFLKTECGVHVAPPYDDTMIAHHIMYPEMLKGLGFLGSLYCGSQEYWKDMVKFDNIKDES